LIRSFRSHIWSF